MIFPLSSRLASPRVVELASPLVVAFAVELAYLFYLVDAFAVELVSAASFRYPFPFSLASRRCLFLLLSFDAC